MFDLVVSVNGRPFPTSRALVSQKSEYLRSALGTDTTPLSDSLGSNGMMSHLALPAMIPTEIFAILIAGIHHGPSVMTNLLNNGNIYQVFLYSQLLQIPEAIEQCKEYLKNESDSKSRPSSASAAGVRSSQVLRPIPSKPFAGLSLSGAREAAATNPRPDPFNWFPGWPYPISTAFHSAEMQGKFADEFNSRHLNLNSSLSPPSPFLLPLPNGNASSSSNFCGSNFSQASSPVFFPSQFMLQPPKTAETLNPSLLQSTQPRRAASNSAQGQFSSRTAKEVASEDEEDAEIDVDNCNDVKVELLDTTEDLENKRDSVLSDNEVILNESLPQPWDVAACDGPVRFHRILNPILEDSLNTDGQDSHGFPEDQDGKDGGKTYECLFCNHIFKSHYCYQKHKRRHINPFAVDFKSSNNSSCSGMPPEESGDGEHVQKIKSRILKDINVQFFPCKICGAKFPSYYFVHKHKKRWHKEELAREEEEQRRAKEAAQQQSTAGVDLAGKFKEN